MPGHKERMDSYIYMIEDALERYLPEKELLQGELLDAMRYSLLAGGKRIRPLLLLEFCRVSGGEPKKVLPFACALEMIHAYSLIHDDLPAMDNDCLRRGKPCNHIVYGEATALLAGSSLLSAAFETMLNPCHTQGIPPERALRAAYTIAFASGLYGMAGGQQLDMKHEGLSEELSTVAQIHALKTGALITAAARAGCILAGAGTEQTENAAAFAADLGLVFQMTDDILDMEGSTEEMGKTAGTDRTAGKWTYAGLLGVPECRRRIEETTRKTLSFLEVFEEKEFLVWLAEVLSNRRK